MRMAIGACLFDLAGLNSGKEDTTMAVMFSGPFASLFNLQQTLDASRASSWLESGPSGSGSYPPVNVFRKGDDLVVLIELAGIKKSDLEIQVKNNTLRIAGRKAVDYSEKASLHRRERLSGEFDRAVTFPIQIDADRVKAEYRNGMLALSLPRAERDKPKSITIS
jgi:HSP20 family protein